MKAVSIVLVLFAVGAACAADTFDFVFSWGSVRDEATARAYAEIGVTDVLASGGKGCVAAKRHGLRPYCQFLPPGPHPQVLGAEAQRHFDAVNAVDLPKDFPKDVRAREIDGRRKTAKCRFGGEPVAKVDTCLRMIPCFLSDTNCVLAKAQLDKTLEANPLAEGVAFDFIGYVNFHSCECAECQTRLTASGKSSDAFFRESLVGYINALVAYVKTRRPGMKVTIHLYPVFLPDPLYGSDLTADTIQQTVAWYFPWPDGKIVDYTRRVIRPPRAADSVNVPFVGLNATEGQALACKSPELLDHELRLVLKSGGRSLGVCNGRDMLKPGYREVFQKYCCPQVGGKKMVK